MKLNFFLIFQFFVYGISNTVIVDKSASKAENVTTLNLKHSKGASTKTSDKSKNIATYLIIICIIYLTNIVLKIFQFIFKIFMFFFQILIKFIVEYLIFVAAICTAGYFLYHKFILKTEDMNAQIWKDFEIVLNFVKQNFGMITAKAKEIIEKNIKKAKEIIKKLKSGAKPENAEPTRESAEGEQPSH